MKLPPGHVAGQGVVKPTGYGGFGERMLKSMGWAKGQGLGKTGDGIKEAISVKKKEDTVGVGGNNSYKWEDKWWERAFDSAVQTIGSGDASDSSDSESSDDEQERSRAAAVAAAVACNRDGTRTSASADELKLMAQLSKGGRLAAGRFGGRDAKLERIRAQEARLAQEAAARLGLSTTSAATSVGPGSDRSDTTSEAAVVQGNSSKDDEGREKKKEKAVRKKKTKGGDATTREQQENGSAAAAADQQQQPQQPAAKRQRIVIEPRVAAAEVQYAFAPTPVEGWWGAGCFVSAGCLEGLAQEQQKARERVTFDEDMQASIYNRAQAGKTQGKVGLGQGTGTIKVGGVKWEGKKVTFELEEGTGNAEAAAAAAAADTDADGPEEGAVQPSSKLAAAGSSNHLNTLAAGGAPAAKQQQEGWQSQVKWKKIIAAQLAGAPEQQMKLKQLQRAVVAAVLQKHGSIVSSKEGVKAAFLARLESSSKFLVAGKLVRLRA